jgi:hypothetical protein
MSYLKPFDRAVREHCGRLTPAMTAKTGYYRKTDMTKSYQDLYKNPTIQARFGGGVSQMKDSNPDPVGLGSIGDVAPPLFAARRYSLAPSPTSLSMFSDDSLEDNQPYMIGYWLGDSNSSVSERSFDSPPLSEVAMEERVGTNRNMLMGLYDRGLIDAQELGESMRQQESRFEIMETAPTGEQQRTGIRADLRRPAQPYQPAREMGRAVADSYDDRLNDVFSNLSLQR